MDLYPRRRNLAAQVAEELKTVTYATQAMEECRFFFFFKSLHKEENLTIVNCTLHGQVPERVSGNSKYLGVELTPSIIYGQGKQGHVFKINALVIVNIRGCRSGHCPHQLLQRPCLTCHGVPPPQYGTPTSRYCPRVSRKFRGGLPGAPCTWCRTSALLTYKSLRTCFKSRPPTTQQKPQYCVKNHEDVQSHQLPCQPPTPRRYLLPQPLTNKQMKLSSSWSTSHQRPAPPTITPHGMQYNVHKTPPRSHSQKEFSSGIYIIYFSFSFCLQSYKRLQILM